MPAEPLVDPARRLNDALVGFARLLVSDYDLGDVLYDLCDVGVDVAGVTGAGILLEDVDGRLRYAVASDALTSELEGVQLELGEGPCMLAHATRQPVLIPDLAAAKHRFPAMVPPTLERGMRAVFTLPLLRNGESIGIMDLYRDTPGDLSPGQADAGSLVADMVTTAVLNRRRYDDSTQVAQRLQRALDARILMEQAKGRVGAHFAMDMRSAERLIHDFARGLNRPVGEVVREIAAGTLSLPRDEALPSQKTGS